MKYNVECQVMTAKLNLKFWMPSEIRISCASYHRSATYRSGNWERGAESAALPTQVIILKQKGRAAMPLPFEKYFIRFLPYLSSAFSGMTNLVGSGSQCHRNCLCEWLRFAVVFCCNDSSILHKRFINDSRPCLLEKG